MNANGKSAKARRLAKCSRGRIVLSVRVTPEEYLVITQKASLWNLSASRFLVESALSHSLDRVTNTQLQQWLCLVLKLTDQVARLGRNINQVARGLNRGQNPSHKYVSQVMLEAKQTLTQCSISLSRLEKILEQ